jgi:ADP-ribosyl-[dinitrogen reductase] hydrolase
MMEPSHDPPGSTGPHPMPAASRARSPRLPLLLDATTLQSRLTGALWGFLIGDAVGGGSFPSFHELDGTSPNRGDGPAGTWGEGGTLMLALLDSLLEAGFDTTDQAERMVDAYRDNAYVAGGWRRFDVGPQVRHAVHAFEHGTPAEDCGSGEEGPPGNAAIKRILAVGLAERGAAAETVVDHALRSSRIVDGSDRAGVSSALYVLVVRGLLSGVSDRGGLLRDAAGQLAAILGARDDGAAAAAALRHLMGWRARHLGASADSGFWAAWDAFAGASSYVDAVERGIRDPVDPATTAALAGGLAGASWGLDGIPTAMLLGMRGRRIAGRLLDGLIAEPPRLAVPTLMHVDRLDLATIPGPAAFAGRLGTSLLPGTDPNRRHGVRRRVLQGDAARLRDIDAVDVLLLLVVDHELAPVGPAPYAEALARHGVELIRHPIPDLEVPDAHQFQLTLATVADRLHAGRSVLIACRSARGRTAMAVGCLLRDAGLSADETIAFLGSTRPGAIETPSQEAFIRQWAD